MSILDNYKPLESQDVKKKNVSGGSGVITIVNSLKNGKRIILSKELEELLGLKDTVNIAISDSNGHLLFYKVEKPSCNTYSLCRQKKGDMSSRLIVYNSALVKEIAEKLNLDFSGTVSVTFYGKKVIDECGNTFVSVRL